MTPTPRLKNASGTLVIRNDDDSANGDLEINLIKITGGAPDTGKVLTSDADGNATWEVNAAIELAENAQTTADEAKTDAANAQVAADNAQVAANAAQTTANTANSAAGAAGLAATAAGEAAATAGLAAAAANTLAVAAGVDAAAAQTTANNAFVLADQAYDKVLVAYPQAIRVFGDELFPLVGTPFRTVSASYPYNLATGLANNADSAYTIVNMRAGTWSFRLLTQTASSLGRLTIAIEGNPVIDPQELYSLTNNANIVFSYDGFTVPADGVYTVTFTVSGKHASSSGFAVVITKFWGIRTGG